MKHRVPSVIAAVGAFSLLIAGCAGPSGTDVSADDGASTFVYAINEPDHLTPGRQTMGYTPVLSIFSPLVTVADSGEIVYVQAESVTSDDNVTWTIALRDGWTFHNGEPVTAQSYVDAWNFTALSTNAWANAGQLASIVGFADLQAVEGDPAAETMSGLTVVDDRTFTVELVGADSSFPLQLSDAQTAFYPMPEAAYEDLDAYDRKPIGNGPFQMSEDWQDNTEFDVVVFEDFAGDEPTIDGITFRSYEDPNTGYTDVLAGNADLIFLPTSKYRSAPGDFGDRLYAFDAPTVHYLGFPLWDERYSDQRVRQAISMSIDRDAINDAIYGGLYAPATALTPPAMIGTPEGVCGEFCEFDPEAAKALLAEAGGWEGTMEIVYPGGLGMDELFEGYANQIRQNLGVEDVVAAPSTDWPEYFGTLVDRTVAGPHFGQWGAQYASQRNTLRALFTEVGACFLCAGEYSNADVDELLAQADAAATQDEAIDFYVQVQQRVMEDFPIVPTFFAKNAFVTSDKIAELPTIGGSPVVQRIVLAD